ncbi:MAG: hypothetical protein K6G30_12535 [Acetatifactor sp.]|nr:hypothetical protein [Acetatifactor sp.]
MTLKEVSQLWQDNRSELLWGIAIVMSIIQITPIKINPWTWIVQTIGKHLNAGVIQKLDRQEQEINGLKNDVLTIRKEQNEARATSSRYRILRFDDELLHDVRHTKEHFDQILLDIDVYEDFCTKHPDFRNNLAVMAIKHIKAVYEKCSHEQSFL